jgi:hypothetical protein
MIGIEMMHIMQILFFSMSLMKTLQPALAPIT